jgi:beta-lactamase regulating signal transducer with metallopeptidase domain
MNLDLQAVATAWWDWTTTMSMQVCVLVLIVATVDRLLIRWSWPQLRAALWSLVVIKLVLPPTLTSPVSVCQLGTQSIQPTASDAPELLFTIWLMGVGVLAGLGTWRCWRLRREWLAGALAPAPALAALSLDVAGRLGLRRRPRLVVQPAACTPAVVGFLRPVVVLPASLVATHDQERLEHVLLHELAHVRRKDPLAALTCLILQLVYWFHPGVWWARHRLTVLRELCCDQVVAGILREATPRYRRTLLELSRPLIDRPAMSLGAGSLAFIHRHSQLLARLDWLERPLPRSPLLRRVTTVLLCGWLLFCCVPLGRSPVGPATASMTQPRLEDLRGCMQLRFAVFRALAEEERRLQKN